MTARPPHDGATVALAPQHRTGPLTGETRVAAGCATLRRRFARIALAAAVGALAACTSLPADDKLLAPVAWSRILGESPSAQSASGALAQATATPAQLQFARRVSALDSALTGRPLVPGNRVTLLIDGPATHDAQLAAIGHARHHVHLSVYILGDDEVGRRYLDALGERAAAGVQVRVMLDAYGARGAGERFFDKFREAGIELHAYGPMNPFDGEEWRLSRRMHRKLVIVDGRVAFTGGVNIYDAYSEAPGASPDRPGWRDTNIRIDGPAVAEFQRIFLESWERQSGPLRDRQQYFPELAHSGDDLVRAVLRNGEDISDALLGPLSPWPRETDDGARTEHQIYASYLAAMSESQRRIWITQAYFIPDHQFLAHLVDAAARGVDVRLLLPAYTDIGMMLHASHSYYDELLQAGIRVYEYRAPDAVLHAKTAMIDDVWSTVGSANLDYRSFIHNDEANAIVISNRFAAEMRRMFLRDLEQAHEVRLDEWRQRPLWKRFVEQLAAAMKYWI